MFNIILTSTYKVAYHRKCWENLGSAFGRESWHDGQDHRCHHMVNTAVQLGHSNILQYTS